MKEIVQLFKEWGMDMKNETKKKLQNILDKAVAEQEVAGGCLIVIKGGQETCYIEAGMADRENNIPIKRNQIYRLYSMSKPITATAVLKLVEDGMLDLAEPVSTFFPSYSHQMVERDGKLVDCCKVMTVQNLLHMTSGLTYGGDNSLNGKYMAKLFEQMDARLFGDSPMSTVEFASLLGESPLAFCPGEGWHYGTSADVLGAVVQMVSGKAFGEYLEETIFKPLGMNDTGFYVPEEKRPRLAIAYDRDAEGCLIPYRGNHLGIINSMNQKPAFESGGAGLVSTVDDYARFAQMLLNKGQLNGVRVLNPVTVDFMTAGALNHVQERDLEKRFAELCGYSYGNMCRVMKYPGKARMLGHIGEYGWDGWLGCHFANDPVTGSTIVFMMQKKDAGTTPLVRRMRNIIMSEE